MRIVSLDPLTAGIAVLDWGVLPPKGGTVVADFEPWLAADIAALPAGQVAYAQSCDGCLPRPTDVDTMILQRAPNARSRAKAASIWRRCCARCRCRLR